MLDKYFKFLENITEYTNNIEPIDIKILNHNKTFDTVLHKRLFTSYLNMFREGYS